MARYFDPDGREVSRLQFSGDSASMRAFYIASRDKTPQTTLEEWIREAEYL